MNDKQTEIKPMSEAEIKREINFRHFLLTKCNLTKLSHRECQAVRHSLCKVLGYANFEHYATHNEINVNAIA